MPESNQSGEHIVRAYDEQLDNLTAMVTRMGGLAETQLAAAIRAVLQRDSELAHKVVAGDEQIDDLDQEIDGAVIRLLALRQPMAVDLRAVLTALRISADLERVGDYAKNVAKRALVLNQEHVTAPADGIRRMGEIARSMVKDVLDAYVNRDVDLAVAVWHRDSDVDRLYTSVFRELLTYMMEDPRTITVGTHLLFMAKNLERIGDLTTNIAEQIYFLSKGEWLEDVRPKGDATSSMTTPDAGPEA